MRIPDDNDLQILGQLPADPRDGAKQLSDVPRIHTAKELIQDAAHRALNPDPTRRVCSTGNRTIDMMTGGLLPGWCWVIAAGTNVGKSSLAVALADTNLRDGRGVLIVSVEDSSQLYADRLLLRRCWRSKHERVSADNLRLNKGRNKLTADELALIDEAAKRAEPKPFFMDATGRRGEWIAQQIERALDAYEIDIVILDYLGEVRSEKAHNTQREQTTAMAAAIRGAVKRRKKSIIILSQVTVGDDTEKWPRMHQVRDSRDVVNAAEVVGMLGIAKTDIPNKNGGIIIGEGERGILLEKVKQGRKGFVHLPWDDVSACFLDNKSQPDEFDNEFDSYL